MPNWLSMTTFQTNNRPSADALTAISEFVYKLLNENGRALVSDARYFEGILQGFAWHADLR